MKIYDCFQFFNELDLLEIRLELLYDYVDYFVISETNKTHSNNDKPLYFLENKEKFGKYMDKIIHISESFPENIMFFTKKTEDSKYNKMYNSIVDIFNADEEGGLKQFPTFARDYVQREYCKLGLIDAEDDDIIMVSDLDEIPNPEIVKKIRDEKLVNYCVMQDCHNFFINNICHTNWYGNYSVYFKETKNVALTHLRNKRVGFEKFMNGGWHLSFMGGPDRVRQKIKNYAHQEFNHNSILSSVEDKINTNKDLFGRTNNTYTDKFQEYYFDNMKHIDLDTYYPEKLTKLVKEKFPYLIKS